MFLGRVFPALGNVGLPVRTTLPLSAKIQIETANIKKFLERNTTCTDIHNSVQKYLDYEPIFHHDKESLDIISKNLENIVIKNTCKINP